MADDRENPQKSRFYDVDTVKRLIEIQKLQPPPNTVLRLVRRARQSLDSISGLFVALGGISIVYGVALAVVVGSLYGPVVFLGLVGGMFAAITMFVDRKVGKSIQFGDYSTVRRGLATALGFALVIGTIYLLILSTGLIRFFQG